MGAEPTESATNGVAPSATHSPSPGLVVRFDKRFPGSQQFQLSIAFDAEPGITILFGASGAGKTTVLDCVAGLVSADSGRLRLGERVLFDSAAGVNVPAVRRNVGYVFQDLALFPHLTAQENADYGLRKLDRSERRRRTAPLFEAFRISHLLNRYPAEMSGGERQRVALTRSLVTNPQALLLDEPMAGLDAPVKSRIVDDLRAWNDSHRIPILYVTHSHEEVRALGESVIVLERGRVVAQGTPHQVLTVPRQETIAQLAGFENIFDAVVDAIHEDRGTMTCRLTESVLLETPLVRADLGSRLRVGIRAGDILLATRRPEELSARNVLAGKLIALAQRDVIIAARVHCGVDFEVHLTLAARDALQLVPGRDVWLVVKTHSCHLMAS
jgi:molybdate transport system ATP-binding protein